MTTLPRTDVETQTLRAICLIGQVNQIVSDTTFTDEELGPLRLALGDLAAKVARRYADHVRAELEARPPT